MIQFKRKPWHVKLCFRRKLTYCRHCGNAIVPDRPCYKVGGYYYHYDCGIAYLNNLTHTIKLTKSLLVRKRLKFNESNKITDTESST